MPISQSFSLPVDQDQQRQWHQQNRLSWNAATVAHNSHKGDQAAFFRSGGSTLFPEDIEGLGPVNGLDLLHLQCNSGQDSLSLAHLGARVTGVDISDEAIAFATSLSADSGIPATFVRADVLDYLHETESRFDRAFSSYGTILWLSDLTAWAGGIARVLRPGGRFVLMEFHPTLMMFETDWSLAYDYQSQGPVHQSGVDDYVAASDLTLAPAGYHTGVENFKNPHPCVEFSWGLGQTVTALLEAGLQLTGLTEYTYSNGWEGFEGMRHLGQNRLTTPEGKPNLPMMVRIQADKPA